MKQLKSQMVVRADTPNLNNRIYPKKILEKIVNDFNNLTKDSLVGQMGMPHDALIHFNMASHVVENLYLSPQNELLVDIRVLDTPCGKQLSELIDKGNVAFRLQGVGAIESVDGIDVIQDSYKMVTINAVPAKDAS